MKAPFLLLALAVAALITPALRADDWKTNDGKVYQDVKVLNSQPDSVTILHHDGGATIPLANLPKPIQDQFHYDPAKAKAVADARAKTDAENRHALQAEMNQASDMNQAGPTPTDEAPTSDTPTGPIAPISTSAPSDLDVTHYTMDDLASGLTLRRNLSDPDYHTTAHLTYMIRTEGLGPDRSDPNHHSISEIADGGL
jgi:hypothetical protein